MYKMALSRFEYVKVASSPYGNTFGGRLTVLTKLGIS